MPGYHLFFHLVSKVYPSLAMMQGTLNVQNEDRAFIIPKSPRYLGLPTYPEFFNRTFFELTSLQSNREFQPF